MKNTLILSLLIVTLSLNSCDQAEGPSPDLAYTPDNVEHFAFGTFYGFCIGNCTNVYKLQGDALFADKVEREYPDPKTTYQNQSLDTKSVNKAKDLLKALPEQLLGEDVETIGCPDCADQGGFYVEIKLKGKEVQYWRIDTNVNEHPTYLKDFLKQLNTLVQELKQ
jgi:hypothetical protein